MWIVMLYICVSQACNFIDSAPVNSQADCQLMLENVMAILEADKNVVAYDGDCVYIKMRQV